VVEFIHGVSLMGRTRCANVLAQGCFRKPYRSAAGQRLNPQLKAVTALALAYAPVNMFGGWMKRTVSGLSIAVFIIPIAGCVPLASIFESKPIPDITSFVPQDLLTSPGQILVLTQSSSVSLSGALFEDRTPIGRERQVPRVTLEALFKKGNELQSLNSELTLVSESGAHVASFVPVGGGGSFSTKKTLDRLCLVTFDGRQLNLVPGDGKWDTASAAPLTSAQRDAAVAKLRMDGDQSFESIDGLCRMSGKIEWSRELRNSVTEFLSPLPIIRTGDGRSIPIR
jgi:hypothetical protein